MSKGKFKVIVDGVEYEWYREIEGARVLKQTITVVGKGIKDDKDFYGAKYKPVALMEFNAKLVALDIIKSKDY